MFQKCYPRTCDRIEVEARVAPAFPTPSKIRVRIHMFLSGSKIKLVKRRFCGSSENV